jgi:hypothetical protein
MCVINSAVKSRGGGGKAAGACRWPSTLIYRRDFRKSGAIPLRHLWAFIKSSLVNFALWNAYVMEREVWAGYVSDCRPYQVPIPSVSIARDWCFPEQGFYMNVLINLPLYPVCCWFDTRSLFLRSLSVARFSASLHQFCTLGVQKVLSRSVFHLRIASFICSACLH